MKTEQIYEALKLLKINKKTIKKIKKAIGQI